MTARRFISLYYGSIGKRRALRSVLSWLAGAGLSPEKQRTRLSAEVRKHFDSATGVFAFGSARSALAACLQAAGVKAGDEVLLSSYTCLAVPTAVIAAGATPVYVDVNAATLNADADTVIAALTPRVKVVVVQHTLGKVAEVARVVEAARTRSVIVLEDCALAIGSRAADGRLAGVFADAALFSMELSKTLSCGWGGVLVAQTPALAAALRTRYETVPEPSFWAASRDLVQTAISAWSHQPALFHIAGKYALYLGFKSGLFRRSTPEVEYEGGHAPDFIRRLGGAQALLAARQWRDLARIAGRCEAYARRMRMALGELGMVMPGAPDSGEVSVAPRVSFLAPDRQQVYRYFFERGVEVGEWFDGPLSPVPSSPLFNYRPEHYPQASAIARQVVNLPCHSRMTDADVADVIAVLRAFVQAYPQGVVRTAH